jgi:hypothetical protein
MAEKEDFLAQTLGQDLKKARLDSNKADKKEFREEIGEKQLNFSKLRFVFTLALIFFFISVIGGLAFYLLQSEGIQIPKPVLEKPSGDVIGVEQVRYLLLNGGAYKLHRSIFTGEPATVLVWITNTGQKFTVTVANTFLVEERNTATSDILISLEDSIFDEIYNKEDTNAEIQRQKNRERLFIDKQVSNLELAIKGYVGFNSILFPRERKILFLTSNQLRLLYLFVVISLTFLTVMHLKRD